MKRHALVVGINQWRDARIQNLKCAERDAREVAGLLNRLGFNSVMQLQGGEADQHALVQRLDRICDGLSAEDLLLFYFAGHGVTRDGQHYLLCADAISDSVETADKFGVLPLHALIQRMQRNGPCHRFILTDACRNGVEAGRSTADSGFSGSACYRNLGNLESISSCGHVLLNSCEDDRRALELAEHGLFTRAFLDVCEVKRQRGEVIWANSNLRDALGDRMRRLAIEHALPPGEQWPLLVEGRPLPLPLNSGQPADSVSPQKHNTASPMNKPSSVSESPVPIRSAQVEEFCSACGKRLLTRLDIAGRCQYAGCHEPVCNNCWSQQQRLCLPHLQTKSITEK